MLSEQYDKFRLAFKECDKHELVAKRAEYTDAKSKYDALKFEYMRKRHL